ncbi:hypothetical protein V6N11_054098 [Hibiscus sabdariffa]|uniref:Uncharacterized protein n=1 Tax=Hibiscus sabdariffa TaxID=183260 RepID=A0ABR2S3U5_9ROSI
MDPISPRPLNMGLQSLRNDSKLSKVKGKLSWAASIDAKVNAYYNKSEWFRAVLYHLVDGSGILQYTLCLINWFLLRVFHNRYWVSDNLLESVSRSLYREANVQLKLTTSKGVVFYLNVVSISWVW